MFFVIWFCFVENFLKLSWGGQSSLYYNEIGNLQLLDPHVVSSRKLQGSAKGLALGCVNTPRGQTELGGGIHAT